MTDEREIQARHEEVEHHGAECVCSVHREKESRSRDAHADRTTLLALLREREEERDRLVTELDTAKIVERFGTPFDPTGAKTGMEINSLRASRDALQADLQRVRGALEMLWWAACHVEIEPQANEWSQGEKVARTLSQELSEPERASVRAALAPARPGETV